MSANPRTLHALRRREVAEGLGRVDQLMSRMLASTAKVSKLARQRNGLVASVTPLRTTGAFVMDDGWARSAGPWIAAMGERGDWGREHVLDPIMLERASARRFARALDVGCGEGRFCRMLRARDIHAVGIDPTEELLAAAKRRDPKGEYQFARAESLPFSDASFDLVVSYLTLIDIADFRTALREMARVLVPKGILLIANLNSFITSCPSGWIKDQHGNDLHYPVDRYLEEFPEWVEWSGIRVENWHRPLSAYVRELLAQGLTLTFFDEPQPQTGESDLQARYRRAPWFMVMEWQRQPSSDAPATASMGPRVVD